MKHKDSRSNLPIDPGNWGALKGNVAGLAAAAHEAQRTPTEARPLSLSDIRILESRATHPEAVQILKENGLRPLTLFEVLFVLTNDPETLKKLKGERFHIDCDKSEKDGHYKILMGLGLLEIAPGARDPEKTIRCYKGKGPFGFVVHTDLSTARDHRRFALCTVDATYFSSVIVGAPKDSPANNISLLDR